MISIRLRSISFVTLALAAACSAASPGTSTPEDPRSPGATTLTPSLTGVPPLEQAKAQWRRQMAKTPTPKEGCFDAVHPSTQWVEVPCGTERHSPPPGRPATAPAGSNAGPVVLDANGPGTAVPALGHATAEALPAAPEAEPFRPLTSGTVQTGTISTAVGSFPGVTVSSETDNGASNVFSLQLNTNASLSNSAVTALCKSTATPASCTGWVQFVYWQGAAEIWYNLLGEGSSCPSSAWQNLLGSCYLEAPKTATISGQPISNLVNMSVTGTAGGATDTVIVATGPGQLHAATNTSLFDLAASWTYADFNVAGNESFGTAQFGAGTTLTLQLVTDSATGSTSPPTCNPSGNTTGESNSLTFVPNSCCVFGGSTPGISFQESNLSSAKPQTCALAAPRCTYSSTEQLSSLLPTGNAVVTAQCTPDPGEDPIVIYKQVGSSWQSVDTLPANNLTGSFVLPSEPGSATVTFLACSVSNGESWVVGPGVPGCDAAASNVAMPADVFYATPSAVSIPQNSYGYTTMMIGGPWARGLASTNETFTVSTSMPGSAVATYSSELSGTPGVEGAQTLQIQPALTAPLGSYNISVTGHDAISGVSHTLNVPVTITTCQPLACSTNQCGTIATTNGCGGPAVSCGTCASGDVCSSNRCCPSGMQWDSAISTCICAAGTTWSNLQNKCIKGCTTPACECIQAGGEWDGKYCE